MTDTFPHFYVSEPPENIEDLSPVYYKVTGYGPDGQVFWRRESMDRSKEDTFYDLFLEEKNGFGLERVEKCDTPWRNSD